MCSPDRAENQGYVPYFAIFTEEEALQITSIPGCQLNIYRVQWICWLCQKSIKRLFRPQQLMGIRYGPEPRGCSINTSDQYFGIPNNGGTGSHIPWTWPNLDMIPIDTLPKKKYIYICICSWLISKHVQLSQKDQTSSNNATNQNDPSNISPVVPRISIPSGLQIVKSSGDNADLCPHCRSLCTGSNR